MGHNDDKPGGPDLKHEGIPLGELEERQPVLGHIGDDQVAVVREGDEVFAVSSSCSHWGGPLHKGLYEEGQLHCPWHHARFSIRTGQPTSPPGMRSIGTYGVERRDGRVFVTEKRRVEPERLGVKEAPPSIYVIGAGAAGAMAVETLRREGYEGPLALISAEGRVPYDRPNLSKDYLAGSAPESWIPLRSKKFYDKRDIELLLGRQVLNVDPGSQRLTFDDGTTREWGAVLLAPGSVPRKLDVPGSRLAHVRTLRSFADSKEIIERAGEAERVVIVGASFIGLEVAAALTERQVEVHVVAPESSPMEKVFGREIGEMLRELHEEHGVRFHLGRSVRAITTAAVELDDVSVIKADLVVAGVGVEPAVKLAAEANLELDRGVLVDQYLQTSEPGIWAAGDIARWPDHRDDRRIRVEHWVVAQRQGQTAARNMLGHRIPFRFAPFFWTQQYDLPVNYVGHAPEWDEAEVFGSVKDRDATVAFRKGGKIHAVATIYRDVASLRIERAMERGDDDALETLVRS